MNNFREIKKGDLLATIKTNKGDMKFVLFPEAAPKAVESFATHAKEGYYDGIIFHRVIEGFMIQGGDPTGTGMAGESIWGRSFEDEFALGYHNFYGALSMANAGPNTNGSQFFVVQAKSVPENLLSQMKGLPQMFSAETTAKYAEIGGTPWLDGRHTVFGHLIEGADVLDDIAAVRVGMGDKPVYDVVMETILIEEAE